MLDDAQVAHARSEIEDRLAAFERGREIAGQELAQHRAGKAVVHEAVITGIEWTNATDETRIGKKDDDQRDRDQGERQSGLPPANADQKPDNPGAGDQRKSRLQQLSQPYRCTRRKAHRERRLLLDRDPENPTSDVIGAERSAFHRSVRNRLEALVRSLP